MQIDRLSWNRVLVTFRSAAKAKSTESAEQASGSPLLMSRRDVQDGLKRLRAVPSIEESAKHAKRDKVGLLKQRLDALKMMLLHASPQQAKALAQELRSIAKELASIGKSLGGNSGASSIPNTAELNVTLNSGQSTDSKLEDSQVVEAQTASEAADSVQDTVQEGGGADAAIQANHGEAEGANEPAGMSTGIDSSGFHSAQGGDDQALRALLIDARKLLKEAIGILKPNLASADKEAKQNRQAAEKSMAELDKALSQGPSNHFYTAQGDLNMSSAADSVSAPSASGGTYINLTA